MGQFFHIHPETPQLRLIQQTVSILDRGGLIVMPTDSSYCFACKIGDKNPLERLLKLRKLEKHHNFTLLCQDLKTISSIAQVSNFSFKIIKQCIPGPYVFILKANKELPKWILNPKRRTIGVRVSEALITQELLKCYAAPLLSSTLLLPNDDWPMTDPEEIYQRIGDQVDLVVDGGFGELDLTTVINLENDVPEVIRQGKGDVSILGL